MNDQQIHALFNEHLGPELDKMEASLKAAGYVVSRSMPAGAPLKIKVLKEREDWEARITVSFDGEYASIETTIMAADGTRSANALASGSVYQVAERILNALKKVAPDVRWQ